MNKNILLYVTLFVLFATLSWFFVFRKGKGTLSVSETSFAVEDTSGITMIFLARMSGEQVTLERGRSGWTINRKYAARPDAIRTLLSTARSLQVGYPVPAAARDNVLRALAANAVKVEIYEGESEPSRTYYVGEGTSGNKGTYMKMEGAENPYVVSIPGFEGYLTPRYFTDATLWRDRTVLNHRPADIRSVRLEYLHAPAYSFEIRAEGDSYSIHAPEGEKNPPKNPSRLRRDGQHPAEATQEDGRRRINQEAIRVYLANFSGVGAEGFENEYEGKDSILKQMPFCILTITEKSGRSNRLVAYYMPVNRRSKMQHDTQGNPVPYDVDRMFALVNNGRDFAIIQLFVFGKIFRRYEEFVK